MELFREKTFELLELMDNSLPTVTRLRSYNKIDFIV
jgi:hypothetical protein